MKKDLIVIILIIILNCILLNCYLAETDELWVYANTYKISIGYQMYEDLNIIQTPLCFILGSLFLRIFGRNFLVFRIYGVLMNTCFIGMLYFLFRVCKINRRDSILYIIALWGMTWGVLQNGANYNVLVYIFVLLGIILEIKYKCLKEGKWWTQTLIAMLAFLTKQNIGIYYFVGICILELIWNKKISGVIKQIASFSFLLGILAIVLNKIGILEGFISYTILGLNEFRNENLYIDAMMLGVNIITPIAGSLVYFYLKIKRKMQDDNLDILYVIGMLMLLFAYPIFNSYHVLLSVIVITIFGIYVIEKVLFQGCLDDAKYNKWGKRIILILIFPVVIYDVMVINHLVTNMKKDDWKHPFFGAIFKEELYQEIETITKYIQEKEGIKVIVISNKASLYNVPLGICNGEMDLPLVGNLGKEGEEGLIRKVQRLRNSEILIDKEYASYYQRPMKMREWIQNNLEKKGEIENFIIYDTPKE